MKSIFRRQQGKADSPDVAPRADALIAEGNEVEDRGDLKRAQDFYERALAIAPDYWRVHVNRGNALLALGHHAEAIRSYRRSIELNSDIAGTHLNLGNALLATGHHSEALEHYRMARRLKPDWVEAWFGLGCALECLQQAPESIEAYEKALSIVPEHPKATANLARLLTKRGDADRAKQVLTGALRASPHNAPLLVAQAEADLQLGDCESSVDAYREALEIEPENLSIRSSYLFSLNLLERIDTDALLIEHRKYAEILGRSTARLPPRVSTSKSGKPLKIGYVSPDFRRHSVSCFIEPLLRHHDRDAVAVHCYYSHVVHDEITERFVDLSDRWFDIAKIDDGEVARRIADDGLDILVDLAGHTTGNRLGIFARKPAPLQFTWLGYLGTTGLDAIDYRICDAHTDPSGIAEAWQVEKPVRLPQTQWCYQPQLTVPETGSLPRLTNGYWTFGSFNQAAKLNVGLLKCWARLLLAIPESRLKVVGISAAFERKIRAIFASENVAANRLDCLGRIPLEAYFSLYREVDIALDSVPYNGATTTCDALIMGVPVATISGNRSVARSGVSLLSAIGLDDWIAGSGNDLITMVQANTQDPYRLASLRASLPALMRSSPIMDGPRFARELELIYRTAWNERGLR